MIDEKQNIIYYQDRLIEKQNQGEGDIEGKVDELVMGGQEEDGSLGGDQVGRRWSEIPKKSKRRRRELDNLTKASSTPISTMKIPKRKKRRTTNVKENGVNK